ncbi:MAG: (deoxy)nucleoside triphosphate pyrophosphohydrolase [Clostridiaceae bacterium]
MKTINVVAAVIKRDNKTFATERGYGEFKGGWEFPGGKVEPNETLEQALCREIKEELDTQINIDKFLTTVEYDYPTFHLTMHCFLCSIKKGNLTLLEHSSSKWLDKQNLDSVPWLPADVEVVNLLKIFIL